MHAGFSVGVQDTVVEQHTILQVQDIIAGAKAEVRDLTHKARQNTLERQPGASMIETFEQKVNGALNGAITKSGKAVQAQLDPQNNINAMVHAGSKGSQVWFGMACRLVAEQSRAD